MKTAVLASFFGFLVYFAHQFSWLVFGAGTAASSCVPLFVPM
jgi:hypothetical protein